MVFISCSVLIFMLYARPRSGLVNRNITERNFQVSMKKFAFYKCCETFAFKYIWSVLKLWLESTHKKISASDGPMFIHIKQNFKASSLNNKLS